jgi:AraC family transcriptional regulator, regulatory protein of adaptative response / methylated-DNA-[protein]-cysteine methyltransferase
MAPMTNAAPLRPPFSSEEERWTALCARDPAADGHFVYAVKSTGIYCRPSCASAVKRRENVEFYLTPAHAEAAGFRPCKRCRPSEAPRALREAAAIARACRLIDEAQAPPALKDLAAAAGMSPFRFHRVFKAVVGLTPKAYARAGRGQHLQHALCAAASVTEAAYEAGFNGSSRFYAEAASHLGMTPTAFRAGGAGETIRFAIGASSLGAVLVAATARGLCAIFLGEDPDALVRALRERFAKARLIGGDAGFEAWVAKVVGFVEAPRQGLDLPLDIQGTVFQRRVWQALREIPPGSTASYAQIAAKLGQPKATRAVAGACAANPLALAIPCHRIVRSNGALSGYRWGVARKRALLARETEKR